MIADLVRYLDVDLWREHFNKTGESLHVFMDGEDVTLRCYRAAFHMDSSTHGDVALYQVDDQGRKFRDHVTGKVAVETKTGRLEILRGAPFS